VTPYRDKFGKSITVLEWSRLFTDRAYRTVAEYQADEGRILTEWTGLEPLFYTFVNDARVREYETMAAASAGHVIECMRVEGKIK
jgi:hypothetical protein